MGPWREATWGYTSRVQEFTLSGGYADMWGAAMGHTRITGAQIGVIIGAVMVTACDGHAQTTRRVSVSSNGAEGNELSFRPALSGDGRFVAFVSFAPGIVPGVDNGPQVYVRDRATGHTTCVSVNSYGEPGNAPNSWDGPPCISADGRYVVFQSYASNLAPAGNEFGHIYRHDRVTGQTIRVSVSSAGSPGNDYSWTCCVSADGRFVAFTSWATNFAPGDSLGTRDVFLRDCDTGLTTLVDVSLSGGPGNGQCYGIPSISETGRFVAFSSYATNLVAGGGIADQHAYVRDVQAGMTVRVSVSSDGLLANRDCSHPTISADGRIVTFASNSTNLAPGNTFNRTNVYIHDRLTGQTIRASAGMSGTPANGESVEPTVSGDGRFVAYWSQASDLVPSDLNLTPDAFVYDRQTGQTERVSVDSSGHEVFNDSTTYRPSISENGRIVAFVSGATTLVRGDENGFRDVFVRDRAPSCLSDATIDGVVDFIDLNAVLSAFGASAGGPTYRGIADLNDDQTVDFIDLNIVLGDFGSSCPVWQP